MKIINEDNIGFIELLSHTANGDLLVVNAARCSFDKQHEEFDGEKDTRLINYLAREGHFLPFRHPSATIRIHVPIFALRQLSKHQVGMSWSEVSRRYISTEPEFWTPEDLRTRPDNIKQGSAESLLKGHTSILKVSYLNNYKEALQTYNYLLDQGVCPEQARAVLPQSMYTTTVTTGTLLSWHHLYTQRTEEHTQLETQEYAQAIGQILAHCFPVSWRALNDNR
jgi:thymidylate synthase (FAD)